VKFVPFDRHADPTAPGGAKLRIVGGLTTVNELLLVAVPPGWSRSAAPSWPRGTVAWIAVAELTVKLALTPLNATAVRR